MEEKKEIKKNEKTQKKKLYRLYSRDRKLYIEFIYKDKDGEDKRKVFSKSIKTMKYSQAKDILVQKYYDFVGKIRPFNSQSWETKQKIAKLGELDIKPDNYMSYEKADMIDWKELFTEPRTMAMIASSYSGKTYLLEKIYQQIKDQFTACVLTSASLNGNTIYKKFKKLVKMDEVNEKFVKFIYTIQKHTKSKFYNFLMMYDDINPNTKHSEMLNRLVFRGRNMKMSLILSVQDSKGFLSKAQRQNFHYMIIMGFSRLDNDRKETMIELLEPYFRHQISDLPKGKQVQIIKKFCDKACENHGFIFLNQVKQEIYVCKNKLDE